VTASPRKIKTATSSNRRAGSDAADSPTAEGAGAVGVEDAETVPVAAGAPVSATAGAVFQTRKRRRMLDVPRQLILEGRCLINT
jgi:hypothetical protein